MTSVGALVLSSAQPERVVAFHRAIGVPLVKDDHGDGVLHWACELEGIHVALFRGDDGGTAPGYHEGGSTFVGFRVPSVAAALAAATAAGATLVQSPTEVPRGLRALISDPDGRAVEVFEPGPVT